MASLLARTVNDSYFLQISSRSENVEIFRIDSRNHCRIDLVAEPVPNHLPGTRQRLKAAESKPSCILNGWNILCHSKKLLKMLPMGSISKE